jgi:hypothetical protein
VPDEMRTAARAIARAVKEGSRTGHDDYGGGRYRATVTRWVSQSDFRLDVHGEDLELDEDDVNLGQSVRRYDAGPGIDVGDSLILIEVGEDDFVAVEVESVTASAGTP